MKLGRSLAVGDFTIWSEGQAEPVAHATVTYAIPPCSSGWSRYYNTVYLRSLILSR